MEKITVRIKGRSYPILIGEGILFQLGRLVRRWVGGDKIFVVTDERVGRYYLEGVAESLKREGYQPFSLQIPEGEASKSMEKVLLLYDSLNTAKMDRASPLLALGGGVVGDITGFVSATYLRGVPYVQVPTSLIAQVDASVGGKTGVNHPLGKNLIGCFHQPRLVYIDVMVLETLDERDFVAGLAEVIKYGAIWDERFLSFLEDRGDEILKRDGSALLRMVKGSCSIKARIVERDEREQGLRAILNFGHTIGHAVETLSGYERFRHGEAVAMGMAFAASVSEGRGLLSQAERDRLIYLIKGFGLPTDLPKFPLNSYIEVIERDKKGRSGKVNFVLTGPLGTATLQPMEVSEIFRDWETTTGSSSSA